MKRISLSVLCTGILFLPLLCTTVRAQITTGKTANYRFDEMMRGAVLIGPDRYANVKGNPFIEEEFQIGEVYHKDSTVTREVPMRLNHHTDQIEFKIGEDIMVFAKPLEIDYVMFGLRYFAYFDFTAGNRTNSGYFEVLAWGNCKLLIRRNTIVKREELPPTDMSGGNYRDYFRTTEEYYIKKGANPAVMILKTKNSIFKALGDHEKELEKYIEDNKLKTKSDEDLIDLIYHYNAITQGE